MIPPFGFVLKWGIRQSQTANRRGKIMMNMDKPLDCVAITCNYLYFQTQTSTLVLGWGGRLRPEVGLLNSSGTHPKVACHPFICPQNWEMIESVENI